MKFKQVSNLRKVSLSFSGKGFASHRLPALRFRVACAAKPETVCKVVEIVKKQLALPDDRDVSGESKFATLGADSLDTVNSFFFWGGGDMVGK
ncbi:acyl carrier protein 1 chloroplastic [Phtheirospermum japonicum]|uniref:Acyl carrier protein 1 chloroplastic n=1 Tax=Phtheirospermum japonicum TaxID=374723 RepID=A0A830C2V9_9LAMI|nr:acyl carrier protein 1 chloroplastic [Phtheirospermum japonicum]